MSISRKASNKSCADCILPPNEAGSAENYYSPNAYARGSDSSHYPSAVPSVAGLSQPVPGATTADERLDPNMGLGNVANGSQTSLGDENDYSRKRILR